MNGPDAAWFRGTQVRHQGHIQAGGVNRDVAFADTDHSLDDEIDAAYRTKYRRYAKSITDAINSPGPGPRRPGSCRAQPDKEQTQMGNAIWGARVSRSASCASGP